MIRIEHLNKFFNKGKQHEIHVINDISLDLPERGMVAIFGKSGCGKTTLLNVIGGLDRFSGGSLTVNGQDIREDTDARATAKRATSSRTTTSAAMSPATTTLQTPCACAG